VSAFAGLQLLQCCSFSFCYSSAQNILHIVTDAVYLWLFGYIWLIVIFYSCAAAFEQDQHIGPSDRFVDDSLVCRPAPIVSWDCIQNQ